MSLLEKCRLMAPNIQVLDCKIANPPEERTVKVLDFQLNNKDTESTLVVDFSLALDLYEINNRCTTAHLDHHLLVEKCC